MSIGVRNIKLPAQLHALPDGAGFQLQLGANAAGQQYVGCGVTKISQPAVVNCCESTLEAAPKHDQRRPSVMPFAGEVHSTPAMQQPPPPEPPPPLVPDVPPLPARPAAPALDPAVPPNEDPPTPLVPPLPLTPPLALPPLALPPLALPPLALPPLALPPLALPPLALPPLALPPLLTLPAVPRPLVPVSPPPATDAPEVPAAPFASLLSSARPQATATIVTAETQIR